MVVFSFEFPTRGKGINNTSAKKFGEKLTAEWALIGGEKPAEDNSGFVLYWLKCG